MGTEVEEGKQMPCRLVAVNNYEDLLVLVDEAMGKMANWNSSSAEMGGKLLQVD